MNQKLQQETRYRLLKLMQSHPDWGQRQLAHEMGMSLGKLNYCLRALKTKGFVKAVRFVRTTNKSNYRYILTPKGIAEKARVTVRFLARKECEFENIQRVIASLKEELNDPNISGSVWKP